MNITSRRVATIALLTSVLAASTIGCDVIREMTYRKDFTYLDKEEVEKLMQSMGESMAQLDQLVADATPENTVQQKKIITELSNLEGSALRLSGGHNRSNQFLISEHIEDFINDIGTAKMFASLNPPRYDKIEYVTHACDQCHQLR